MKPTTKTTTDLKKYILQVLLFGQVAFCGASSSSSSPDVSLAPQKWIDSVESTEFNWKNKTNFSELVGAHISFSAFENALISACEDIYNNLQSHKRDPNTFKKYSDKTHINLMNVAYNSLSIKKTINVFEIITIYLTFRDENKATFIFKEGLTVNLLAYQVRFNLERNDTLALNIKLELKAVSGDLNQTADVHMIKKYQRNVEPKPILHAFNTVFFAATTPIAIPSFILLKIEDSFKENPGVTQIVKIFSGPNLLAHYNHHEAKEEAKAKAKAERLEAERLAAERKAKAEAAALHLQRTLRGRLARKMTKPLLEERRVDLIQILGQVGEPVLSGWDDESDLAKLITSKLDYDLFKSSLSYALECVYKNIYGILTNPDNARFALTHKRGSGVNLEVSIFTGMQSPSVDIDIHINKVSLNIEGDKATLDVPFKITSKEPQHTQEFSMVGQYYASRTPASPLTEEEFKTKDTKLKEAIEEVLSSVIENYNKHKRLLIEAREEAKRLETERKAKAEAEAKAEAAALYLQKTYRGHLGYKVAKKLAEERKAKAEAEAKAEAAALYLQKTYRGHLGYKVAKKLAEERKAKAEAKRLETERKAKAEAERKAEEARLAAALYLQKTYRGHLGYKVAKKLAEERKAREAEVKLAEESARLTLELIKTQENVANKVALDDFVVLPQEAIDVDSWAVV